MRLLTGTIIALTLTAQSGLAAPATQAEADRLTDLFQTYLGELPGAVTVTPQGKSYALSVDPNAYVSLIPDDDIADFLNSIEVDAFDMHLTDLGDGKWRVTEDESWRLAFEIADMMDFSVTMDRVVFDGIWDQDLLAFQSFTSSIDGLTTANRMVGPDGEVMQDDVQSYASIRYAGTSQRGANGGVDANYSSEVSGMRQTTLVQEFGEPISIVISAEKYATDSTTTGFQIAPLLAMVAQGVEVIESGDPTALDLVGLQEDARGHLRDFLPIFENVEATFDLDNLAVESPFGGGSIDGMSGTIDVNGLVDEGKYNIALALSGLAVSSDAIPPFFEPLIPSDLSLDLRANRFNLNAPARTLIDNFDFLTADVIDQMVLFQTIPQLLPTGLVGIDVGPSNVTAPAYTLDMEGGGTVGLTGMSQGTARFSLEGIDRLIQAINAMPPEMSGQALGPLGLAQGLARQGDAGALFWDIEFNMPRSLKVNGNEMMPQ
ncbi:MAG: hypothetical protein GKR99_20325 [Rhodobacteraceae bacterium]|nr:hypothetical protein [Paracoccaceae bacterium]